jgi:polyhydroxyalkanoate synthase subunit PhaE
MNVYGEWLNTNDKHLTALFATAGYSKLQAELNTFGMKLKQHMNAQMEKAMKNVPVVPRSEMDELYKTVYELRKRINMLEKQLDVETDTEPKETKTAAKKTAKNS